LNPKDKSSDETIKIKKEVSQDNTSDLELIPIFVDENGKLHYNESTAYTTSARDKSNILIATKDPEATRSAEGSLGEAPKSKALGSHLVKHKSRLPTKEEIRQSLEAWRAMLRSTKDNYPDKKKTLEQHLIDLKILMGARSSFNKSGHNNPIPKQQWKHQEYGPIHRQYFIPLDYMAPDTYFEKLNNPDDNQVVYWKRCCSVFEYYVMLSMDNPEYKPMSSKDPIRPNPRDYRPVKNIAHNPFLSSDRAPSDKWGQGLMSTPHDTARSNAWKNRNMGLMGDTSTPPVIRSASMTAPVIRSAPITTPEISQLSEEQQHAAERTHRHRTNIDRSNIPIPQSDDSSQDEDDSLFSIREMHGVGACHWAPSCSRRNTSWPPLVPSHVSKSCNCEKLTCLLQI
jgi:hypothetical protein